MTTTLNDTVKELLAQPQYGNSVLFEGLPGTGKSTVLNALIKKHANGATVVDATQPRQFYGHLEHQIAKGVLAAGRAVVIIDDIDFADPEGKQFDAYAGNPKVLVVGIATGDNTDPRIAHLEKKAGLVYKIDPSQMYPALESLRQA